MLRVVEPRGCVASDTTRFRPRSHLLHAATVSVWSVIAETLPVKMLRSGEHVLGHLSSRTHFARIRAGVAKVVVLPPNGNQQVVDIVSVGDWIWPTVSSSIERSSVALTPLEVNVFSRSLLTQIALERPEASMCLLHDMLEAFDRMNSHLATIGRLTAIERVCFFLNELCSRSSCSGFIERCANSSKVVIHLPLDRSVIADYLGLSEETVCRCLSVLEQKTVIEKRRRTIVIRSPLKLSSLASGKECFCADDTEIENSP